MHPSSYANMSRFVAAYLADREGLPLTIADVGSKDVNGTYRSLFNRPGWSYLGLDMAPGANVDLVLRDPYHWVEVASQSCDVVVSGQAFEHIEYFWLTMLEIRRVLKPGGMCCLIAPSAGPEHRYPLDCWRFYPDGFRALARYAALEVIEVYAQWAEDLHPDRDPVWQDCVLIARRP